MPCRKWSQSSGLKLMYSILRGAQKGLGGCWSNANGPSKKACPEQVMKNQPCNSRGHALYLEVSLEKTGQLQKQPQRLQYEGLAQNNPICANCVVPGS